MRRLLLLLALAGCGERVAGPAPSDIGGAWLFTGRLSYGGEMECADTLTMELTQYGASVGGESTDWHFWCGTAQSEGAPVLRAQGAVRGDSLSLRWLTDSLTPNCGKCLTFTMIGRVDDSVMTGRYQDFLGGTGTWDARRQP